MIRELRPPTPPPPASVILRTVSAPPASSMSDTATLAPSAANRSAPARMLPVDEGIAQRVLIPLRRPQESIVHYVHNVQYCPNSCKEQCERLQPVTVRWSGGTPNPA